MDLNLEHIGCYVTPSEMIRDLCLTQTSRTPVFMVPEPQPRSIYGLVVSGLELRLFQFVAIALSLKFPWSLLSFKIQHQPLQGILGKTSVTRLGMNMWTQALYPWTFFCHFLNALLLSCFSPSPLSFLSFIIVLAASPYCFFCSGKLQSMWQQWSTTVRSLLERRLWHAVSWKPLHASDNCHSRAEYCYLSELNPITPPRERAWGRPDRPLLKKILCCWTHSSWWHWRSLPPAVLSKHLPIGTMHWSFAGFCSLDSHSAFSMPGTLPWVFLSLKKKW